MKADFNYYTCGTLIAQRNGVEVDSKDAAILLAQCGLSAMTEAGHCEIYYDTLPVMSVVSKATQWQKQN